MKAEPDPHFDAHSVALFATIQGQGSSTPAPRGRRKLWALERTYHCPVIGTCLPMETVRRIAQRHALSTPKDSDYKAHVSVVACCETRNPVALAIQHELDRRHRLWLERMDRLRDEAAVAAAWQGALAQGEAAGAYWALLTCRAASDAQRLEAFRDIHMLSHQIGSGARADLKALAAERQVVAELRASTAADRLRLEAALAQRDEQILQLRQAEEAHTRQITLLQAALQAARPAAQDSALAVARQRSAELARSIDHQTRLSACNKALAADNANLKFLLRHAEEERDTLERFVLDQAPPCPADHGEPCPPLAPQTLTGRRLLCVGGRCNLTRHYRQLVEKCGGEFAWHDGGRDESLIRLNELLGGADAVICPADCVSHPAYYQIKRHCKRNAKPCVLLRNSGLASFAAGIARLSRGEVEIGAAPLESPN